MSVQTKVCDYCRLCAKKTTARSRIHLFASEGVHIDLHLKIEQCLQIQPSTSDSLPKIVCIACAQKVDDHYNFRENCLEAEKYLNDIIDTSKNENNEQHYKTEKLSKKKNSESRREKTIIIEEHESFIEESKDVKSCKLLASILLATPSSLFKTSANSELKCLSTMRKSLKPIPTSSVRLTTKPIISVKPSLINSNRFGNGEKVVCSPASTIKISDTLVPKRKPSLQCSSCKMLFYEENETLNHVCSNNSSLINNSTEDSKEEILSEPQEKIKSHVCSECDKAFLRPCHLRVHMRKHTGEKPYSCNYCEKKFRTTCYLNVHIREHEKRWKYICSYCGQGFVDKVRFVDHQRKVHTGERPFLCNHCGRSFFRKQEMQKHMETWHSTIPRPKYSCERCHKSFYQESFLKQHIANHDIPVEERKHVQCSLCGVSFVSKSGLRHHMFSHTGELPYECNVCHKSYSSKSGLRIHTLTHSKIRLFICEVCGKDFALQNTLDCHRRTHTGERPYQCDICSKNFTQKSSLNCHRKRHLSEIMPTEKSYTLTTF